MATMQAHLAFDTLAYAQALISRGFEQKHAEALAVVTRDFVVSGQATNDFVQAEIREAKTEIKQKITDVKTELKQDIVEVKQEIAEVKAEIKQEITKVNAKIDREMVLLENRLNKTNAKMFAFAVGVILTGIPIIMTLIQKLS